MGPCSLLIRRLCRLLQQDERAERLGDWADLARGAAHRASATARGNHDKPRNSGHMPVPLHTSGCAGDRVGTLAAPAQQSEEPVARGALRAVLSRGLLDTE